MNSRVGVAPEAGTRAEKISFLYELVVESSNRIVVVVLVVVVYYLCSAHHRATPSRNGSPTWPPSPALEKIFF